MEDLLVLSASVDLDLQNIFVIEILARNRFHQFIILYSVNRNEGKIVKTEIKIELEKSISSSTEMGLI